MSEEPAVRMPVFVPPEGAPKVAMAIVGVMNIIKEIPRTGYNKEHKYHFVEAQVLTAKVQDAMAQNKLAMSSREISRSVINGILFMKFEFDAMVEEQAIINIGSYSACCRFQFRAGTFDDKASAKCLTSAWKQFEIALFKIPADVEDIERDIPGGDHTPPHQSPPETPPVEPAMSLDVRTFRHALNSAGTREEADRIWQTHSDLLNAASNPIFDLLTDDYKARWSSDPPRVP